MKNQMIRIVLTAISLSAIFAATGCSWAAVSAKPGEYSVNGWTRNPEAAMATASDNYVQETNAREYWKAVQEGRAYPYPGGGYGNDYWYYFGSQGYMPAAPQPTTSAPAATSGAGGYATQQDLQKVKQMAEDSIRAVKRLRPAAPPPAGPATGGDLDK